MSQTINNEMVENGINRSRLWAEINLDNIASNLRAIKAHISQNASVMAIVKADAYGHGVLDVVKCLSDGGVDYFGVAMVGEGIQLRKHGAYEPILVLGYTDECRLEDVINYDITQTVYDVDYAKIISATAVRLGKSAKIHIKIDTGLSRIGFMINQDNINEIVGQIEEISNLPMIEVEGIFSHFSVSDETADEHRTFTAKQFVRFMSVCNEVEQRGVHIPIRHIANSGAVLQYRQYHLDMVRPGIILYGLYPDGSVADVNGVHPTGLSLKPAMEVKAHVTMVKKVPAGVAVSYGRTYVTDKETVIATVPVGYADGYMRSYSDKACMIIRGQKFPIIGRICMDQCMLDVTDSKVEIKVNDVVTIMGRDGECEVSANDLARWQESINYEIVCLIGKRVPRLFIKDGKTVGIMDNLI